MRREQFPELRREPIELPAQVRLDHPQLGLDADVAAAERGIVLDAEESGLFQAPMRLVTFLGYPGLAVGIAVAPGVARRLRGTPEFAQLLLAARYVLLFGAAVAAVAQGLTVLPKTLAERLLDEPAAAVEELSEPLTARESEVLGLLGRGLSNKMIARELHISEHTVKFHISSMYSKLGVSNRAEAVSQGARYGLISI